MTELSKLSLKDGQLVRPFANYFKQTFAGIKGKDFNFEGKKFDSDIEFFEHLKEVLEYLITISKK